MKKTGQKERTFRAAATPRKAAAQVSFGLSRAGIPGHETDDRERDDDRQNGDARETTPASRKRRRGGQRRGRRQACPILARPICRLVRPGEALRRKAPGIDHQRRHEEGGAAEPHQHPRGDEQGGGGRQREQDCAEQPSARRSPAWCAWARSGRSGCRWGSGPPRRRRRKRWTEVPSGWPRDRARGRDRWR